MKPRLSGNSLLSEYGVTHKITYWFLSSVRLAVDLGRFLDQLKHERRRMFRFGVVLKKSHGVTDGVGGERQREKHPADRADKRSAFKNTVNFSVVISIRNVIVTRFVTMFYFSFVFLLSKNPTKSLQNWILKRFETCKPSLTSTPPIDLTLANIHGVIGMANYVE